MRRKNVWSKPIRKSRNHPKKVPFLSKLERTIIRTMIFCAILLTVFQLSSITDPVDFYLRMVGDIDSPAFKYSEYADDNRMSLYFRVSPESEILVKQNDKTIGIIHNELRLDVRSGTVTLDGTSAGQPVIVEIVLAEKKYQIELNGDVKSFDVQFKSNPES